jgi:hypothetical protein
LRRLPRLFADHAAADVHELPTTTGEPTWDVKFAVNGVDVQVIGERPAGLYMQQLLAGRIAQVRLRDADIPCLALEAEADVYELTNRSQKAQRIRAFLQQQA